MSTPPRPIHQWKAPDETVTTVILHGGVLYYNLSYGGNTPKSQLVYSEGAEVVAERDACAHVCGEQVIGLLVPVPAFAGLGVTSCYRIVVVTLSVVNYQPANCLHAILIHSGILHASSLLIPTPTAVYPIRFYSTQVRTVLATVSYLLQYCSCVLQSILSTQCVPLGRVRTRLVVRSQFLYTRISACTH